MEIKKKICPPGLKTNPNKKMTAIEYITIHETGNYNTSSNAENHATYQYNGGGDRTASWHYTVDEQFIWQSYEDYSLLWHTGTTAGNNTSIGIEICVNNKANFLKACDNTAWLTAYLLRQHGLTIKQIRQHYDWSGKQCPAEIRKGSWGVTWPGFINLVGQYLTSMAAGPSAGEERSRSSISVTLPVPTKVYNPSVIIYRVQLGAYANRANAEQALSNAKAAGFKDAFIF